MGAAVGAALRSLGSEVLWIGAGRSRDTRSRAEAAGLTEAASLSELLAGSSVVLSICPPHVASRVAGEVAEHGLVGIFVDANAISPKSSSQIEEVIVASGAKFVDGAIIGGPPEPGGGTRLYLSGPDAGAVAALFQGSDRLAAIPLEGLMGAASSLKMCYAAWTKGTTAMLIAIRAAATSMGIEDALLAEWALSQPGLANRIAQITSSTPAKAWRFVPEMEQIAETLEAVSIPGGFHRAAAEVYDRLARFHEQPSRSSLAELLAAVGQPTVSSSAEGNPAPLEEPSGEA